ncbi:hypothetical protein D3C78_1433550 [compost metagenome]
MAQPVGFQAGGEVGLERFVVQVPDGTAQIGAGAVGVGGDGRPQYLLDELGEGLRRRHQQGEGRAVHQVAVPADVEQLLVVEVFLQV